MMTVFQLNVTVADVVIMMISFTWLCFYLVVRAFVFATPKLERYFHPLRWGIAFSLLWFTSTILLASDIQLRVPM